MDCIGVEQLECGTERNWINVWGELIPSNQMLSPDSLGNATLCALKYDFLSLESFCHFLNADFLIRRKIQKVSVVSKMLRLCASKYKNMYFDYVLEHIA